MSPADGHRADSEHMRAALALARRGLGSTWPNPSVGCVVVREGRVVGRGRTAPGGRPHAEPQALAMAGEQARGATVYVTLEPCCHWGRTPPCTDAMIKAGVARVVVALRDPDPRVDGQGADRLRAAGIEVEERLLATEAAELQAGFIWRLQQSRPFVTLKLASTLDGRIASHGGESQWITGEAARRAAQAMRGSADAILVGIGTVLADDPQLTCRISGFRETKLVRVVVDSHLRMPFVSKLVRGVAEAPVWILSRAGGDHARRDAMRELGVRIFEVRGSNTGVDLPEALKALAEAGITRLLVEGGGQVAGSLLRADMVDRVAWFHAGAIMGGDGWPAAQAFGVEHLGSMPRFRRRRIMELGPDMLSEYERAG